MYIVCSTNSNETSCDSAYELSGTGPILVIIHDSYASHLITSNTFVHYSNIRSATLCRGSHTDIAEPSPLLTTCFKTSRAVH